MWRLGGIFYLFIFIKFRKLNCHPQIERDWCSFKGLHEDNFHLSYFFDPQQNECYLPHPLRVFEMVITPDLEYPLMCVDVNRSYGSEDELRHNLIDLNTGTTWTPDEDEDMDGMATVVPRHNLNVKNVTQIEKDAILVCYESEYACICCSVLITLLLCTRYEIQWCSVWFKTCAFDVYFIPLFLLLQI